jgi:hypothetical protein
MFSRRKGLQSAHGQCAFHTCHIKMEVSRYPRLVAHA